MNAFSTLALKAKFSWGLVSSVSTTSFWHVSSANCCY